MSSFGHSVSQWCFPTIPLPELARAAREIGIDSVELLEPADWPIVKAEGVICAMARGPGSITEGFNRREHHEALVPAFLTRIRECAAAGVPNIVCFSGNRAGLSDEEGIDNCVAGFKQLATAAERAGVTLCLELLNSKIDHPDYHCDRTGWGVEVCKRVASERVKLLYDIYHMQVMEGDIVGTIERFHPYFAHYHTAGVPGRHEIDDNQELNYRPIMRAIERTGFRGFVGQEFLPLRDPLTSLREAVKLCSV